MKRIGFRTMASVSGLVGLAVLPAVPAFAQGIAVGDLGADEIVVTAQRRAEKSVDVPITVTSLNPQALETANVQQLADITKMAPALRFDYSAGFSQPSIRGVGSAVQTSGSQGNVGIYVDGFYIANPLGVNTDILNVASIQVLKGPQGTLFGRNTTGGAVLIQTVEPSTETSGRVKASYGRFNEARAQGYVTAGLTETIALDLEGMYNRGDGWQRNIGNNQRIGDYETWSVRAGIKAEIGSSASILLRYQHSESDDPRPVLASTYRESVPSSPLIPFVITSAAPWLAPPGQYTFDPNEVGTGTAASDQDFYKTNSEAVQATIKVDLGFADVTSYTQYRKDDVDASLDLDYSNFELIQLGLPNDNSTFTQELLVNSKPGTRLQWTAGLFYFQNRDTYLVYFDRFPALGIFSRSGEFGSSTTSKSFAAYLDATYEVTPKLFVTAGARYARDSASDVYTIPAFGTRVDATAADYDAVKGDRVTPRFVVRYKPTEESSVYASFTKGYKAGLLDLGGGSVLPVKPESIDAYEVGVKFDNRRLSFEAAGFYYDYTNLQVSLFTDARARIVNAATAKIYGLEGQLRYDFSPQFQINLGGAWVHGRYTKFTGAPIYTPCYALPAGDPNSCVGVSPTSAAAPFINTFPIIPMDLEDVTMQRVPSFTGNIGARYRAPVANGELTLSGNLYYSSKFFFGPSGIQFPQDGYEVLSLRAQWTDPEDRFTIALWGDNVTNSRYLTGAQIVNYAVGANWNKPVTYGVELGVKF